MNVANQMSDEPKCSALLIARCIRRLEHLPIPRDSLDNAVAQLTIALLVVCVRLLREVDEVVRIHVGDLATSFVGPRRCFG